MGLVIFLLILFLAGAIIIKRPSLKQPISGQVQQSIPAPQGYTKLVVPGREEPFFSLKPITASVWGILPKQTFELTAKEPMEKSAIEKYLNTTRPMTVTQLSPTLFRLEPISALAVDEVLNIKMAVKGIAKTNDQTWDRDYGWSFQAQGKFKITGSLPGGKKTEVPLTTGIELTFSQDDFKNPEPYLTISPTIQFRTEKHGQTWAIVPNTPLKPKTVYTVTLKKGLSLESRDDRIADDYSFSFQTAEERKDKTPPPHLSISEDSIQVSLNQPPTVKVYTANWLPDASVKARIYKFNSGSEFVASRKAVEKRKRSWYRQYQEDAPVDVNSLGKIAEAEIQVQVSDRLQYLQLPAPFSEGLYLVQFWYDDNKKLEQAWVQATNLAAYVTAGREQTLVWANDLTTKTPVSGAMVNVFGASGGNYTGGNGITVFSTPDILYGQDSQYLQIKSTQGSEVYLPVESLEGKTKQNEMTSDDYWSYLYYERTLYKPSDTVNFWGVVKKRDSGLTPSTVNLSMTKGYYGEDNLVISSKNIDVNSDGTFMGSISFEEIPAGWYELEMKTGELLLTSSGFEVEEFEKPEMKIEVTADKKAVFAGEKVNFNAFMSFFDGTPGKQVAVSVYRGLDSTRTSKTTNNMGQVALEYTPEFIVPSDNYNPYPRYESLTITPELAQNSKVEGYASVIVYGSRVMLTSDSSQDGSLAKLKATLNRVDLTGLNDSTSSNVKASLVANAQTSLTVTKSWWDKVEEGTYYDFIEKRTRPSYTYVRKSETWPVKTLVSNNAGEVNFEFEMETGRNYTTLLVANDENGRPYKLQNYFYYYQNSQSEVESSTTPKLTLGKKINEYSLNENIAAKITENGENYADSADNRFLFIAANRGRQDYFVQETPEVTFPFAAKYVPNLTLGAVIFTGSYYLPVTGECEWEWYCWDYYRGFMFNGVNLVYKKQDSKLDLTIGMDKPKYQPGETAQVTVSVSQNSQPVINTDVNIVLVDQALAAIGGVIAPDPLNRLYKSVSNMIYYNYYSHRPVLPSASEAEKGGGGGDVREVFKDTAFFGRARTDSEGKATFKIDLSDNITTWIVYGQTVTAGLEAGFTKSELVASKDFFVTNEAPRQYLAFDKPMVTTSGYGRALKEGDLINYETFIPIDNQNLAKQAKTERAFKEVSFPIYSLPVGDYKLAVKGTLGNLTDQVVYPFSIIDSRISFRTGKKFSLLSGNSLQGPELGGVKTDQPISLTVSDQGQGKYYDQLERYCYSRSNRLEKWIARTVAFEILAERFSQKNCGSGDWDLLKFQEISGGLSQVKWGGSNLETTVWAIRADGSKFDQDKLINYLSNQLTQKSANNKQKLLAVWGLAMLEKPQVLLLDRLIDTSTTAEEKLIGALALVSTGQTEKARDLYLDILADWAYTSKPYVRIEGQNSDQIVTNTAWAALVGSQVEKTYNEGLAFYLRDYGWQARNVLLDLTYISNINEELAKLPKEATKINLTAGSINKSWDLSKGERERQIIKSTDLPGLKVEVLSGKADLDFRYFLGAAGLTSGAKDERLSIKRSYQKAIGDGAINPGDIVRIKLEVNVTEAAPVGSYEINDYLPSGLVYLSNPGAYGLTQAKGMWEAENQIVRGNFYYFPKWRQYDDGIRIYFARAAFGGEYVAEPAVFQSLTDLTVWQATASETVRIESR